MRFVVLTCVALAPACVDAQPTDEQYADTALSIGSTTAHQGGECGAMADVIAIATGAVPTGLSRGDDGALRGHYFGLDYHYGVTCRDAAGAATACGSGIDAADVDVAWSGTLDTPALAMTLARQGHWGLSGIAGGITRVAGDGHLGYATTDAGATYRFGYDALYDVFVAGGQPIGGFTHYTIEAQRGDEPSFSIDATVTFSQGSALLVLDGTRRYAIDLATGSVTAAP